VWTGSWHSLQFVWNPRSSPLQNKFNLETNGNKNLRIILVWNYWTIWKKTAGIFFEWLSTTFMFCIMSNPRLLPLLDNFLDHMRKYDTRKFIDFKCYRISHRIVPCKVFISCVNLKSKLVYTTGHYCLAKNLFLRNVNLLEPKQCMTNKVSDTNCIEI
jgi:hypothetical protein